MVLKTKTKYQTVTSEKDPLSTWNPSVSDAVSSCPSSSHVRELLASLGNPWPYWTALHQTTSPVLQWAVIHLLDSGTRYHSYSNRNKISPVPIWQPFNHLQPPCVPPGPQHFLSRLDIPIPWPHVKTPCSRCGHTSQSTPWWCYCSSWNTVLGTADLLAFSSKGWLQSQSHS